MFLGLAAALKYPPNKPLKTSCFYNIIKLQRGRHFFNRVVSQTTEADIWNNSLTQYVQYLKKATQYKKMLSPQYTTFIYVNWRVFIMFSLIRSVIKALEIFTDSSTHCVIVIVADIHRAYQPGRVQIWWGEPGCRGSQWRTWWLTGCPGDHNRAPVSFGASQLLQNIQQLGLGKNWNWKYINKIHFWTSSFFY